MSTRAREEERDICVAERGERAYEHLLVIGLAAHQPELRIARGVGQLLEAAVGLVERIVRVHEAPLRIRRLVPLPDLHRVVAGGPRDGFQPARALTAGRWPRGPGAQEIIRGSL